MMRWYLMLSTVCQCHLAWCVRRDGWNCERVASVIDLVASLFLWNSNLCRHVSSLHLWVFLPFCLGAQFSQSISDYNRTTPSCFTFFHICFCHPYWSPLACFPISLSPNMPAFLTYMYMSSVGPLDLSTVSLKRFCICVRYVSLYIWHLTCEVLNMVL